MQALRATGVTLLSMAAAGLFVMMTYALTAGLWRSGAGLFVASFTSGGLAHILFDQWLRHSPRHGGKDHVRLPALAAEPARPGGVPGLRARTG